MRRPIQLYTDIRPLRYLRQPNLAANTHARCINRTGYIFMSFVAMTLISNDLAGNSFHKSFLKSCLHQHCDNYDVASHKAMTNFNDEMTLKPRLPSTNSRPSTVPRRLLYFAPNFAAVTSAAVDADR